MPKAAPLIDEDWIYNSPPWLSSSGFVLAGIAASGLVLVALTRLVSHETRHLHNEFTLFTVTNIAVFYTVLLAFIAIAARENLEKADENVQREAVLAEALYLDAQGLEDKAIVSELRTELPHYVETVIDREWPKQRAGHVSDAAEPDLRRIRMTLAAVKPQASSDAAVMQECCTGWMSCSPPTIAASKTQAATLLAWCGGCSVFSGS